MRRFAKGLIVIVSVVCLPFSAGLAGADEPEPTPTPTLKAEKAPPKRPKSLADVAKGIKLQKPEGEEESKGIVIDNANLKESGEGAVIIESQGLAGGTDLKRRYGSGGTGEGIPTDAEMDEAKQDLEKLQAQLEAIEKAAEENKKANMYSGAGPQYRAPGQTDPLQDQRRELQEKVDQAQGAYEAMEKARSDAEKERRSGGQAQPARRPPPKRSGDQG